MRWLVLLLFLCGCGMAPESLDHVRLDLCPTPDLQQGFRLELWPEPPGAFCEGQIHLQGETVRLHQHLNQAELQQVLQAVNQPGAWQDGDSGDSESNVLYTRLEVNWEGQTRVAHWRGLPPAQGQVASALLESPLGPTLRQGLEAVQREKSRTK